MEMNQASVVPQPPPLPLNGSPIPTFKLIHSSASNKNGTNVNNDIIRPTTAGLSLLSSLTELSRSKTDPSRQKSDASSSYQQAATVASRMDFTKELQARQSSLLSSSNSTSPSSLSIDERIQLNKERQRDCNSSLSNATDRYSNQSVSPTNMSDRLFNSSMQQQDKRPFSYNVNMNDPNNRGKIDLSQIKSAAMRRRLLANMASRSNESDDDATSVDAEDYGEILQRQRDQPQQQHHQQVSRYNDIEPVYHHYSTMDTYSKPTRTNDVISEVVGVKTRPTVVHHTEPPRFYDIRSNPSYDARQSSGNGRVADERDIERLNAEIFESLDGLSSFISSEMSRPSRVERQTNQKYVHFSEPTQQQVINRASDHDYRPNYNSLSTFKPTTINLQSNTNNSYCYNPSSQTKLTTESNTTMDRFNSLPSGRTPGDYLLSGDLSYFSPLSSSTKPYAMTAYYGSPLDVDLLYEQNGSKDFRQDRHTNDWHQRYPSTFVGDHRWALNRPPTSHQRRHG